MSDMPEDVRMMAAKRMSFDAAHYLPDYNGKCANLHGHRWTVEVGVEDFVDPETGMVVDFGWIKAFLQSVCDQLDHRTLNDFIANPTAENIARFVAWQWSREPWSRGESAELKFVKIWETPDSYILYAP
jgi:6-pyruvoyltetrahydropterin/6-carboxytetrahydropterin synthase